MPPILRKKDGKQPKKKSLFEALDAPTNSTSIEEIKNSKFCAESLSVSDDSSLSDLDTPPSGKSRADSGDDDDDDDDEGVNWEDAIAEDTTAPAPVLKDLDITLEKNEGAFTSSLSSKKGPSKIERAIRIQTHCMHVQFLLFHNAVRNAWINNGDLHRILVDQLPEGIQKEIKRWRVAAGLEKDDLDTPKGRKAKSKGKGKGKAKDRDWGSDSTPLEPNEPDMSRGDPTIHLLKVLAAYWRNRFNITAPGLRKKGYRPIPILEAEINSFNRQTDGKNKHGERISDLSDFHDLARTSSGSRDVGAQLFTALLRALGMEARMVANLQPIGFGWTKGENYTAKEQVKEGENEPNSENDSAGEPEGPSKKRKRKAVRPKANKIDHDLPFPIYWTEVVSPVTNEIIPVESIVLSNSVATTPELLAAFEPRGAKAEKAKQVIAYVVAYSPDATAKDVTIRYLKRQTWPGKTKGYRIPAEKVSLDTYYGDDEYFTYDWFKSTMRGYIRPQNKRTAADEKEDSVSLAPKQAEKKAPREGDTLQSLRTSTEFVLERFLRREEAIRPDATPDRTFVTGKGEKKKEEKVYRRSDVEKCLSAESWHKEGRRVKVGESPLKLVPIRVVTLNRKREVDELERETGQKPKQGLYALRQTEYIIPPPIKDGVIPKNTYGNIDCFVPTMVPEGAVHIPWPATLRVCRKLGVDCAEAVTGFEFGSKMAVPVIQGVVVAEENEDLVKDAWRIDAAEKRKKEKLKQDKLILSTWRKFIMGLRITERLQEEYGDPVENESRGFRDRERSNSPSHAQGGGDVHETGGGFLVPGQDDERFIDDLTAESHQHPRGQMHPSEPMDVDEPDENDTSSELSDALSIVSISP